MKSEATIPLEAGARPERSDGHPGDRLDGWKAIAGYLGRDIRTVQRWELSEQLPIRRLEHKRRASAYAFTSELDAWLAARTAHDGEGSPDLAAVPVPARGWRAVATALALAALVIGGALGVRALWPRAESRDTRDPQAYAAFAEGSALYWSRQYRDAAVWLERAVSRDPVVRTRVGLPQQDVRSAVPADVGGRTGRPRPGRGSRVSCRQPRPGVG